MSGSIFRPARAIAVSIALLVATACVNTRRSWHGVEPAALEASGGGSMWSRMAEPFRARSDWKYARRVNQESTYAWFVRMHPDSRYAERAEAILEKTTWEESKARDNVAAYEIFIRRYPSSGRVVEARARLEDLYWINARTVDTVEAYQDYLRRDPDAERAAQARARLDDLAYARAMDEASLESLTAFLNLHPESPRRAEVERALEAATIRFAESEDTIAAYEAALARFPESEFRPRAERRLTQLYWLNAQTQNTAQAYDLFLRAQPNSPLAELASERREALSWAAADASRAGDANLASLDPQDRVDRLDRFLRDFPESERAPAARAQLEALRGEVAAWNRAQAARTVEAYRTFLEEHPDGFLTERARAVARDFEIDRTGRPLVEAIAQRKIEVVARDRNGEWVNGMAIGADLQAVEFRMRRLGEHPIRVVIPIGTYLVSQTNASDMVVRRAAEIELNDDAWRIVKAEAATRDWLRREPGPSDVFQIFREPQDTHLRSLMRALEQKPRSRAIEQAAIWIVSDETVKYDDLATLTARPAPEAPPERLIGAAEVVEAMKLCDEAGFALGNSRIWLDRERIAANLSDPEAIAWVEGFVPIERRLPKLDSDPIRIPPGQFDIQEMLRQFELRASAATIDPAGPSDPPPPPPPTPPPTPSETPEAS